MRRVATAFAVLLLSGCASMTPTQKKIAAFATSAIVIGMIAAHQDDPVDRGMQVPADPNCQARPEVCR